MKRTLIFQRHGDAKNVEDGQHESTRKLSEAGYKQAMMLGAKLSRRIDVILWSSAARAAETAKVTSVASCGYPRTVPTYILDDLYPHEDRFPGIATAFAVLKQASLASYLLIPSAAQELQTYVDKYKIHLRNAMVETDLAEKDGVTILVTTHAVCTNAFVRDMQMRTASEIPDLVLVGNTQVEPGAALVVEFEDGVMTGITYVTPS